MLILAQSMMIATRLDPVTMEPRGCPSGAWEMTRIRWPRLFRWWKREKRETAALLPD
ncbi:MAG: hypothetical protein AAGE80_08315 [Pseudomonadota bacterium]